MRNYTALSLFIGWVMSRGNKSYGCRGTLLHADLGWVTLMVGYILHSYK